MAEGCINTHMVRLLGAPPLLDNNYHCSENIGLFFAFITFMFHKINQTMIVSFIVELLIVIILDISVLE